MSSADDELRALRERAFGPRADIHEDPDALERLHELEGRNRPIAGAVRTGEPASRAPEARADDTPAPEPAAAAAAAAGDAAPSGERAAVAEAPPAVDGAATGHTSVPKRRRLAGFWAASLGAAVVVTAITTAAVLSAPWGRVAVLGQSTDGEWPEDMFGPQPEDAAMYDSYLDLQPLTTPAYAPEASADARCLYIIWPPLEAAILAGACGAGSFPARAAMTVTADMPADLQSVHPIGTALEFVLDGGTVTVYADTP